MLQIQSDATVEPNQHAPINSQCQSQDIIYKCSVSISRNTDKVHLKTAEGGFCCYYNRTKSFCNKRYTNGTSISKYICYEGKTPMEIVNYPHPEELLNKTSELVCKCRHANKYLLNNYKANV